MSAQRLPGKPLLRVNGLPIISHVVKKAQETQIGEVVVATEDQEIFEQVKKYNGDAILTSKKPRTGTDRIWEAFQKLNTSNIDLIMNLQGDEPLMNIEDIKILNKQMIRNSSQLGTLASVIQDKKLFDNTNIVKLITSEILNDTNFPEIKSFSRKIIERSNYIYHHLGIYCYTVSTLKKFVALKQSSNEIKNKLEQLRALDNGLKINVALAKSSPIGVDTEEDFVAIKKIMEYKVK